MSKPKIIIPSSPGSHKSRRMVHLLDVEPGHCSQVIHGYGYATVAYWAGVTLESAIKAADRGLFTLGDLASVARYILRVDSRRNTGTVQRLPKREGWKEIGRRIEAKRAKEAGSRNQGCP